ncbi:16S rRNA (cytosine967-C5)-methyltransferase [[Clostridium] fimetarium]|uniref:16S rRNA (cytosine(967)-C(5))-methyltransferase n=1 Tax=[Clostridium] fimetarium TaxID=99656 RepID=A0A1I0MSN4_9FIRM|nr:16S rRNA (cytosine967-C5)-methyltransferase [[Clostridium] fimetarium]
MVQYWVNNALHLLSENLEDVNVTDSVNLRAVILDILLEVNEHDAYSHIVMNNALSKYQYLDKNERAFITRLAGGTIEKQIELDYIIDFFSKTKITKMKPLIRNLLRMSVYQIKYMSQVPDSAVCNEAVKLANKRGFSTLKGFVNGVLRNIARGINEIQYPPKENDFAGYLSIKHSIPRWIVDKWLKSYDKNTVELILDGFNQDKHTYIRCNRAITDKVSLVAKLESENVIVKEVPYVDYALEISGYNYLGELESFQNGMFQIQDISSMIAGVAAGIEAGAYVIDTCAAPGGKCIHAAESLVTANRNAGKSEECGHIDARDLTDLKVSLIIENISRLKTPNISLKTWDARVLDTNVLEKADVLLADLPCSGLGIIGRKADIKYKMTPEKQANLVKLQREILETIQQYVKPGGKLIYSTCTINEDENAGNLKWFTSNFPFELESLEAELPFFKDEKTIQEGYVQLLPGVHGTDGFFVAKLRRTE